MLLDTDGFAIPFSTDDQWIEHDPSDPCFGEPSTWPEWVDSDRWQPSEEDSVWAAQHLELPPPIAGGSPEPFEPTDADWADYHRFCEDVERLQALKRMEDHEYEIRMRYGL